MDPVMNDLALKIVFATKRHKRHKTQKNDLCLLCFLWRKLPRGNLTLLLTVWHSHGCATERMITSSVSTPDCDRVNTARAGARTLSPQTHTGWTDDLPVGRR